MKNVVLFDDKIQVGKQKKYGEVIIRDFSQFSLVRFLPQPETPAQ